jgi:hypothetical protein
MNGCHVSTAGNRLAADGRWLFTAGFVGAGRPTGPPTDGRLARRLTEIPQEIDKEMEGIRKRFAEPQPRMFPVAATFLVPARLAREGE